MTEILNQPLNNLQSLAQTLFHSLSPTQARPPPAPPISVFAEVDAQLAAAVKLARKHQIKQRKIERLKDEVLALEQDWREIIQELQDGKQQLEVTLNECEERLKAIEESKAGMSVVLHSILVWKGSQEPATSFTFDRVTRGINDSGIV